MQFRMVKYEQHIHIIHLSMYKLRANTRRCGETFGVHLELPLRNLREHSFEALVGGAVPPEEYYGNDAGVPIRRGSGAGLYYCPLLVTPTNTCAN